MRTVQDRAWLFQTLPVHRYGQAILPANLDFRLFCLRQAILPALVTRLTVSTPLSRSTKGHFLSITIRAQFPVFFFVIFPHCLLTSATRCCYLVPISKGMTLAIT